MKSRWLCFLLVFALAATLAQCGTSKCGTKRRTGLLPPDPDEYSKVGIAVPPPSIGPLPASVDFSGYMPPVGSQIPQNSCVAWALGYGCRSYYVGKETNTKFVTDKKTLDYSGIISPAFIYNLINNGQNKGARILSALKLLADTGACSYESMPYQKYNWHKQPTAEQLEEAKKYRIVTYRRIDPHFFLSNLKAHLAAGIPVVTGTVFDKKYYNYGYNTKESIYLWSTIKDVTEGMGHAILLVGYDDSLKAFKFMNSWGEDWGNEGFGWISYNLAPQVMKEACIIMPAGYKPDLRDPVEGPGSLPADTNTSKILGQIGNVLSNADKNVNGLNFRIDSVVAAMRPPTDSSKREIQLQLKGTLLVPPMSVKNVQVVVQFFRNRLGSKAGPVFSLDSKYALMNNNAAVSTDTFTLSASNPLLRDWNVSIPVSAMDIPEEMQTKNGYVPTIVELFAEPVLFIDGFAIRTGKPVAFSLKR